METATLTSRYRFTLPKVVRESIGAIPGDKILFAPALHGYRLVAIKSDSADLRGVIKKTQPVSTKAMNRPIAKMGSRRESR